MVETSILLLFLILLFFLYFLSANFFLLFLFISVFCVCVVDHLIYVLPSNVSQPIEVLKKRDQYFQVMSDKLVHIYPALAVLILSNKFYQKPTEKT